MSRQAFSCAVLGGALIAYFIIFPADLGFVSQLLSPTQSVATGAWALLIAIVIVAGAVRVLAPEGRRPVARGESPWGPGTQNQPAPEGR